MDKTTVTPYPMPSQGAAPGDLTGRLIAGCLIESKLGQGGMGVVYKAFHQALDIPVAIKVLIPYVNSGKDATERFIREARAAAKLRHPNIVGVLNVGIDEGVNFIVMEYLSGGSLQALLNAKGAMSINQGVGIALSILDALSLAFENHIVHRDIKPDNILFDNRECAKLSDLGLAKQLGTDLTLTQTGVAMGSPHYMAPEQASDFGSADHRADIYSLGCVFYHTLAGKPPYGGNTHLEVILKHINETTPDLRSIIPTIDTQLAMVVQRMMAKSVTERYQTPLEVVDALQPFVNGSSKASRMPHMGKKKTKNQRLFWGISALLSISVAAIVILLFVPHKNDSEIPGEANVDKSSNAEINQPVKSRQADRAASKKAKPYPKDEFLIIDKRSNAPVQNKMGTPPRSNRKSITSAVWSGRNQDLQTMLDKGAQPNVYEGGATPIHFAVRKGDAEAVRILLEKGANPSALDNRGDSPLHIAIRNGNGTIVQSLLNFGSNPNIPDANGDTPLELARKAGNGEMVRILRERGAN